MTKVGPHLDYSSRQHLFLGYFYLGLGDGEWHQRVGEVVDQISAWDGPTEHVGTMTAVGRRLPWDLVLIWPTGVRTSAIRD